MLISDSYIVQEAFLLLGFSLIVSTNILPIDKTIVQSLGYAGLIQITSSCKEASLDS